MQLRISELRVVFLSEDYLWKNYNISHEKIEVATAAVYLLIDVRSQIHYMEVQADYFCVYNCCCLYNCNAMQWFETKIRTDRTHVSCPKTS